MKKSYEEIMDTVEVDEEMRKRILNNIQSVEAEKPSKIVRFSKWKKYGSIAACIAILLTGAIMIPNIINREQSDTDPDIVSVVPDITEASSVGELSKMVGFEVADLEVLPITVEESRYVSYWKELAEITYTSGEQTIVYRKSIGSDDNSGDYSNYGEVVTKTFDTEEVTLKGNGENYNLASWVSGKYSYSLRFTEGVSEEEIGSIILENK
ncbi:hypothetical protein [Anaerosporobacter sp.]|uniref:hypothetical protein n=1 Tax=Anaerosporobacter sp. TaxID=1872529 RepID=UPI00286F37A1|nr:hypothetical protein [Anaerosporobacter sp.]